VLPGRGVGLGKDHTIFALKEGTVTFSNKRKTGYNGKTMIKKIVHVS
jgi:ribosomal protein L27